MVYNSYAAASSLETVVTSPRMNDCPAGDLVWMYAG